MRPSDLKSLRGLLDRVRGELSSIREAIEESTASVSNQRVGQQKSEEDKREKIGHAIDNLAHQEDQSCNTAEANQDRRHGQNLLPYWITAIATCLAFIAASIYAGIAAFQLGEMKVASQTAQNQLANFEDSERAILTITPRFTDDGHFEFIVKNIGHTPIDGVTGRIWDAWESDSHFRGPLDDALLKSEIESARTSPSQFGKFALGAETDSNSRAIPYGILDSTDPGTLSNFRFNHDRAWHLHAVFFYDDGFGKKETADRCIVWHNTRQAFLDCRTFEVIGYSHPK
jgi:hypothetical protein